MAALAVAASHCAPAPLVVMSPRLTSNVGSPVVSARITAGSMPALTFPNSPDAAQSTGNVIFVRGICHQAPACCAGPQPDAISTVAPMATAHDATKSRQRAGGE